MKFECQEISIGDEELGCFVTLSENNDDKDFEKQLTVKEIMESRGQYIMLQRTYGDEEIEEDHYYFEASEFEKSGELNNFIISLTDTLFILTTDIETYEIQIHPDRQTFEKLRNILIKLTEHKGKLNINPNSYGN